MTMADENKAILKDAHDRVGKVAALFREANEHLTTIQGNALSVASDDLNHELRQIILAAEEVKASLTTNTSKTFAIGTALKDYWVKL